MSKYSQAQSNIDVDIEHLLKNAPHYKRLLQRLPSNSDIAFVSMTFHAIARKDKSLTPVQLLDLATSKLSEKYPHLIKYFDLYRHEVIDFATYVLLKTNLPEEALRALKQKQHEKYIKENMATKPPTLKQISMLRYLGFEGSIQNRFEASEMISSLKESAK